MSAVFCLSIGAKLLALMIVYYLQVQRLLKLQQLRVVRFLFQSLATLPLLEHQFLLVKIDVIVVQGRLLNTEHSSLVFATLSHAIILRSTPILDDFA